MSLLNGVRHLDPEKGEMTAEPTIDQLETSAAFRYPISVDQRVLNQMSPSDAVAYLEQATASASGPYRVCGYSPTGVLIQGYDPLPYRKLKVVAADATLHGERITSSSCATRLAFFLRTPAASRTATPPR